VLLERMIAEPERLLDKNSSNSWRLVRHEHEGGARM
jgi:hypothetical protein